MVLEQQKPKNAAEKAAQKAAKKAFQQGIKPVASMGKLAARLGDNHLCPLVDGIKPHVGGPILPPNMPTVLIGGQPAAVVDDPAQCVGPTDKLAMGSQTVKIGGKQAVRVGDTTNHGGMVVQGLPTVLIGD